MEAVMRRKRFGIVVSAVAIALAVSLATAGCSGAKPRDKEASSVATESV
jgi:hypothetical protein